MQSPTPDVEYKDLDYGSKVGSMLSKTPPHFSRLTRPDSLNTSLEMVEEDNIQIWHQDLNILFLDIETRYPDVVWKTPANKGLVWGHQAVVYARAHRMVRAIYLPKTPSQLDPLSLRHLETPPHHNHPAFLQRLRYYYTGQSTTAGGHPGLGVGTNLCPSLKLLSKDFISIWRSQRFTDLQISVGPPSATQPVFHCHRFILSSRSPYFRGVLANSDGGGTADPTIINLPFLHFTADSFDFILGYIYGGTLEKSHPEYNISTALGIFRGSLYLGLSALEELMLAEISVNMLHTDYHGPLPDNAYSSFLSGHWTTLVHTGCLCQQCPRHAPLVLRFALASDIQNNILEYSARCRLVALFGNGWYTEQFSALPPNITDLVLVDIRQMITPRNVFPLLFAAEHALMRQEAFSNRKHWFSNRKHWYHGVKAMIISVRQSVEMVLCTDPRACFESPWQLTPRQLSGDTAIQAGWIAQALQRGGGLGEFSSVYRILLASLDFGTRSRNLLEHTELEIQKLTGFRSSENVLVSHEEFGHGTITSIPEEIENDVDWPVNTVTQRQSPQSSLYRSVMSVLDREDDVVYADGASYQMSALDLASTNSLYSYASSRTISTDYGIYYTRRAISRETVPDWDARSSVRRRRSCESF